MLLEYPHRSIRSSPVHIDRLRRRYVAHMERVGRKPLFYGGREKWKPIPSEFEG
jgi:hypothetical protein